MLKNSKRFLLIFIGLLIFFLGMYAVNGIGIYDDSGQYIIMHVHREPLYPLFLAIFRVAAGEDAGLVLAVIMQNILTSLSIVMLIEYLRERFSLSIRGELVLLVLELMPHLATRYVSTYGIVLESSILSEALCIPLFQFFALFTLRMIYERKKTDVILSFVFAWLLSMTRGQMMTTILIWMVITGVMFIMRRQYRRLLIPILAVVCAFGMRSLSVHTYNYFVTGYFIGNTYGQVTKLTNVIYACDEEDGEVFEDGSLEREFFNLFYADADAMGANYKYGGSTFTERAAHLEEYHDKLKFEVLDANMTAYYFGLGKSYYEQSILSDKLAGEMFRKLFPLCLGQWLYDYILLCSRGFIRSIAVVHPLINWIALLIYAATAGLVIWRIRRRKYSDAVWMMGVALLFIIANVCATSLMIMCLSRYMIYGFSLFYMALFLLIRESFKNDI
ncbi:MAG: hypothetical protein J1D87_00430 [Lachnospiraceae bacterium]|nr:hypothetical protein [Lachnospiraceae bacterium]